MSTLTGEDHISLIQSEADLAAYFARFAKPVAARKIGIEVEFFGIHQATGQALPYEGAAGIHAALKELVRRFRYEPVLEEGNIIALKRHDTSVTLEPGGQVELSAPPAWNVFEIERQVENFLSELREIRAAMPGIEWITHGIHPFSRRQDMPWVPKTRYRIMAEHFKTRGTQSHDMMQRTATNQVNFDYTDEADALNIMRTVLGLTSIVTALFAHSAFAEGRPSGYICQRLDIWNHTDPDRAGLLVDFTEAGKTFEDYVRYLLDMPMMFLVRKGKWMAVRNRTFRQFIREGYEGAKATWGDFELHLSGAFPEARLKQFIEIRGTDCQRKDLICAVAAFWKGILYDRDTREKAWQLVAEAPREERLRLHQAVPHQGLSAKFCGKPILPVARELVRLSCASLEKQKGASDAADECRFLHKICHDIIDTGKTPAQTLLEKWNGEFGQDPAQLIRYLSIG